LMENVGAVGRRSRHGGCSVSQLCCTYMLKNKLNFEGEDFALPHSQCQATKRVPVA
jgi:hypothetical protein